MTDSERKIPRTMSTQHPDNINVPEWSPGEVIDGNTEIFEAFYAFESLGCQEVMWDSEGKDVDTRVVRKLFDKHLDYFRDHIIGRDLFLTYRIPNPGIEPVEKKVVVETLQNVSVSYDVASSVYKTEHPPIFEIILPYTTKSNELIWLYNYYKNAIVSDQDAKLDEQTTAKDWLGSTKPKSISVIPLVEDFESHLEIDKIILPYIEMAKPKDMRVFLARSDPALNYGLLTAVILSKIALSKLGNTAEKQEINIHPIIGVGSKPFRGHLSPENVDNFLEEYKGISTVTVQSAARYDYPASQVKEFIKLLNNKLPNGSPIPIQSDEEEILRAIIGKCQNHYESLIELIAPFINSISPYVPQRRARKLHIGLFGYSRSVAGVSLPRAITFSAAMYSIGIPPEFLGLSVLEDLNEQEWNLLQKYYVNMHKDLILVGGYVSWQNINMLMEMHQETAKRSCSNIDKLKLGFTRILDDLRVIEEKLSMKIGPRSLAHRKHENFTNNFLISYLGKEDIEARKALIEAARIRRCLG